MEALDVGSTDKNRAEVQIGWTERQLRRWVSDDDVIGLRESVSAHRTRDGEADSVSGCQQVAVANTVGDGIGGRPVAKVPEAVRDGAGREVGERNRQRLLATGWLAAKTGRWGQRADAQDRISGIAAVESAKEDHVAETADVGRRKAQDDVGGGGSVKVEHRFGENVES